MAEQSGFFDAHLVNGEYDRTYLAEHFAKYFSSFIGNGIFGGKSNELIVRENESPNMGVRVLSGKAFIDGYWYENDDELALSIDIADGVLNRIDAIVLRWNHSERTIRAAIKKGVPGTNPVIPALQRDNDYYELKLADIYIKAGATKITQTDIFDKRLNTDECGLVIGIVQQLDAEEFGIQLDSYISDFIAQHNEWSDTTQADFEKWINDTKSSYNTWFTQFKSSSTNSVNILLDESELKVNNLITTKTAEINTVIANAQQRFDDVIDDLEKVAADNDIASIVLDVSNLKTDNTQNKQDISTLKTDVSSLKTDNTTIKADITTLKVKAAEPDGIGTEDTVEKGCYYITNTNGIKEWVNPPNKSGIEYRTTERWQGSPVYQKVLYVASLPNKTLAGVHVEAHYQKIIYVSGFAIDNENNMHYPFPIIQNGLTPIAVIQGVESDGGDESDIVIQTNENISHMTGYITVKYTK